MMKIAGRGGPANREEAAKLLASSAKLGKPKAAYNLALLYLEGQSFRRTSNAPPNCSAGRRCRQSGGAIRARDVLQGRQRRSEGPRRGGAAAAAASLADNVDAEVEYAIALYNGTGTPKNHPAAVALLPRPPGRTARSRKIAWRACW